ncbi:MAG: tetratricopeptide repeat protein, partial [Bacteroidota bacterium]
IIRDDQVIDRTRYLQVLPKPEQRRGGTSDGPFSEVLEKCARLLRESPDTKYTDDALLLIGKSYFYQSNYEGAKLNLNEAIRVAQEEDQGRTEDEARLWLGRSLAANGQSEEATNMLRESIDREGARAKWTSLMRIALAQIHVQDERWAEAASALTEGIPRVDNSDLAARAQFLLGQVYEALGQYDEAAEAYAGVRRYRPLYELRYASELNTALALGLRAGQTAPALDLLRDMLRDDNNFSNRAELEVARARVLVTAQEPARARDVLLTLLYDDEGQNVGQMRGQALYRLGEVYRDGFDDYTLAAAYLDSAATSLRAPTQRRSELTTQALLDVDAEAQVYLGFADAARRVAEYDSLLELGQLDDDAFRARIFAIQEERQLAAAQQEARQARLRSEQGFRGAPSAGGGFRTDTGPAGIGAAATATGGGDFGFLAYRNPARVQESFAAFQATWGERPLVPNWRRREAITLAVASGALSEEEAQTSLAPTTVGLGVDVTAVPRTIQAQATMRADRAAALYEMGTALFLAIGRADSAAVVYREVIESADEAVAERAYYALAEAERALGNGPEADRWYRYVIETYPESDLADQARERLGLAPVRTGEPERDRAEAAYDLAYATWQEGDYPQAFLNLLTVSERYPESDVAPRALLAAGRVYSEWATTGSVDLFEPLPQADTLDLSGLYGQIAERYAGTPYAQRATTLRDALEESRPAPDTVALDPALLSAPDSLALPDLDGADRFAPPGSDPIGVDTTASAASLGDRVAGSPTSGNAMSDPASADSTAPEPAAEPPPLPGLAPPAAAQLPTSPSGTDDPVRNLRRIRPDSGGMAWVVGTFQQRADAEPMLRRIALDGYQTALVREERGRLTRFLVVVGQFRDAEAANEARADVLGLLSEGVQPYQFSLDEATIVLQGADLRGRDPSAPGGAPGRDG